MDCKDLMVGDWVSYKDDPPYMVRGTSICKVVTIDNGIDHRNVMDDAINPIPLTDDILEKNGFEKAYTKVKGLTVDENLYFGHFGVDYVELRLEGNVAVWKDYDEKGDGIYSDYLFPLPSSVHELQHLLRLCGIEKELTI